MLWKAKSDVVAQRLLGDVAESESDIVAQNSSGM